MRLRDLLRPWPFTVLVLTANAIAFTVGIVVLGFKLADRSECVVYPATNALMHDGGGHQDQPTELIAEQIAYLLCVYRVDPDRQDQRAPCSLNTKELGTAIRSLIKPTDNARRLRSIESLLMCLVPGSAFSSWRLWRDTGWILLEAVLLSPLVYYSYYRGFTESETSDRRYTPQDEHTA